MHSDFSGTAKDSTRFTNSASASKFPGIPGIPDVSDFPNVSDIPNASEISDMSDSPALGRNPRHSLLRSMLVLAACLGALLALRSTIVWLDATLAIRQVQRDAIVRHDIEPAALFYTELPAALTAEKRVRARLQSLPQPPVAPAKAGAQP